jgi:hypothetical protein
MDDTSDKMQNCTMERPKLFMTGFPNYLFIIQKASELAKQHGMDYQAIRSEALQAGPIEGKKVLAKYFEVV